MIVGPWKGSYYLCIESRLLQSRFCKKRSLGSRRSARVGLWGRSAKSIIMKIIHGFKSHFLQVSQDRFKPRFKSSLQGKSKFKVFNVYFPKGRNPQRSFARLNFWEPRFYIFEIYKNSKNKNFYN